MRKGFSMLTAIILIILVATLGALAIALSTTTVKQTSDLYLREQAELLVQSATEYTLLAISGHQINSANGCLNTINATYENIFDINISIYYLGSSLPSISATNPCQKFSDANLNTIDSNVTVIIDTTVSVPVDKNISTEPIRIHRRTIQKP